MATSPTTQEKTMTVDECGISTPDPTDEEIFAFFNDILQDDRGMIGKTWKNQGFLCLSVLYRRR